jgi:tartrate-resistant acid phosphatase type 5
MRGWKQMRSILSVTLACAIPGILAAQSDQGRIIPANRSLHVIAIGDFGSGSPGQLGVAHAIQKRHEQAPFDLGITVGDNFYRCGVTGVNDRKWTTRWEDLYGPLGIRFFASLGNHDYGHPPAICLNHLASPDAEVAYTGHSKTWEMPARYYTFAAGPVRFFALDTEGWSEDQLAWIRKELADTAYERGIRWRIVYGHHPIFTSGFHANQRRIGQLRRELLPVLEAAKVDLYVCGHDHDIERLHSDDMDFLIAGAGGAKLRPSKVPRPESVFRAGGYGFLELNISEHQLSAQYYNTELTPLDPDPLTRTR